MSNSYEAHRLVIEYLAALESAPLVVKEVEKKVFAEIDKIIKEWVGGQSNWEGRFDYLNEETAFKPISWENGEKGDYNAWYKLNHEEENGEDDAYHLSILCGISPARFGIQFSVDTAWVTKLSGKGSRPGAAWKNYLADHFPATKLKELGFELQGESIFYPVTIDAKILSDGYPNAIDDALEPVRSALEQLEKAHAKIDDLFQAALKHSF